MLVAISQNYPMRREALRAKQMIEPRSPASGLAAQRESLAPSIVIIVALVFVGRGKPSPTRWLRRRHANDGIGASSSLLCVPAKVSR